jgi:hypothetical protein
MHNDLQISETALRDAIRWCNYILKTRQIFSDDEMIDFDRQTPSEWRVGLPGNVRRLVALRSEKLHRIDFDPSRAPNVPGSILVFYPYRSMHDGLAQAESNDLFDVHGCPFHGFWIDLIGNSEVRLLSWIPYPFLDAVERVIKVDAAKSLAWVH